MSEILHDGHELVDMTYEEAAQIIKTAAIFTGRCNGKMRLCVALHKAIEALEAYGNETDILYLCDRKKEDCPKTSCSKEYCSRTTDINHAVNFNKFCDFDREDGSKYKCFVEKGVQDADN